MQLGTNPTPFSWGRPVTAHIDRTIFEHSSRANFRVHFDFNEFWPVPLFYIFSSWRSFRIVFLRPRTPILVWFVVPLLYIKKTSQIGLWGVDYCFDPNGIYRIFIIFVDFSFAPLILLFFDPCFGLWFHRVSETIRAHIPSHFGVAFPRNILL